MHDLGGAYLRKARDAALAKNSVEEDRWLNEARAAGMKTAEIAAFQRDLSTTRQKALQAESERELQLARERIRDGRLTDPAQDSAAYHLGQVQTNDPNNASLAEVSREFTGKLLERARASVAAGKPADADITLAKRFGADPKDIIAVQQAQNAPKAQAAIDPAILAANLKRLRSPSPDYPRERAGAEDQRLGNVAVHGEHQRGAARYPGGRSDPPGSVRPRRAECHQTLALRAHRHQRHAGRGAGANPDAVRAAQVENRRVPR